MPGTVLCVDNDRDLIHILSKALETEGYEVQSAYDGDEAVALATEQRPDLVLLDLILPRRDGFEVLEALRAHPNHHTIPVVVFTAKTLSPAEQQTLSERVNTVIRKQGLDREMLLNELRLALGRSEGGAA